MALREEQEARSKEQRARSKEQEAKRREQGAGSTEQGARSKEQGATARVVPAKPLPMSAPSEKRSLDMYMWSSEG